MLCRMLVNEFSMFFPLTMKRAFTHTAVFKKGSPPTVIGAALLPGKILSLNDLRPFSTLTDVIPDKKVKKSYKMTDTQVRVINAAFPEPNDTKESWQKTVLIFKEFGLYQDETPEELSKKLGKRTLPLEEQRLWMRLCECLLAIAERPSWITGCVIESKTAVGAQYLKKIDLRKICTRCPLSKNPIHNKTFKKMNTTQIMDLYETLPTPNDTKESWQKTVQLFQEAGLYNGETPEQLENKLDQSMPEVERQLWITLTESLLALAGRPSWITGITHQSK